MRRLESEREFRRFVKSLAPAISETVAEDLPNRLQAAYYILGWLVGDLAKHFSPSNESKMRVSLELTTRHPENLLLGEYVMRCLRLLGIPCKRIRDRPVRKGSPNPEFRWLSKWSYDIMWMYQRCLGLERGQSTSRDPVKMEWLFTAPAESRLWFFRGLADSDGSVNFRNNNVTIITCPNTELVRKLAESLGMHAAVGSSRKCGLVILSTLDAARVSIFNPEILTHRRKMLAKLVRAKKYQRRWPTYLSTKVSSLIRSGLTPIPIARKLLDEDEVYVKTTTVKRYARKLKEATAVI